MIVKDLFRNFHLSSIFGLESRALNKLSTEKLSQSPGEKEGVKINQNKLEILKIYKWLSKDKLPIINYWNLTTVDNNW